jgi:hypothetical protein
MQRRRGVLFLGDHHHGDQLIFSSFTRYTHSFPKQQPSRVDTLALSQTQTKKPRVTMKILSSAFVTMIGVSSTVAFVSPSAKAAGRANVNVQRHLFKLFGNAFGSTNTGKYPIYAEEAVMSKKAHGTSEKPVQKNLRWKCDYDTADRICNFNRHYAEHGGYWETTDFLKTLSEEEQPIKFYDSVTGAHLFTAPIGRSMEDFVKESIGHGWPSFRDQECIWDDVRCLKNGECISVRTISRICYLRCSIHIHDLTFALFLLISAYILRQVVLTLATIYLTALATDTALTWFLWPGDLRSKLDY